MPEGPPETRTSRPASSGRATASRRTVPVRDGVLQLFASLSIEFSRKRASFPTRRLLDGLQGPAEHGHGRRGRRRRRAARALLLARRLVRGTGADRPDARVTYGKGRVAWGRASGASRRGRASVAAAACSGGVASRERGRATGARQAFQHKPAPPALAAPTRRRASRPRRHKRIRPRAKGAGSMPVKQLRCANARARRQ